MSVIVPEEKMAPQVHESRNFRLESSQIYVAS